MPQYPPDNLTPPPGGTPRLKPTAYPLDELVRNAAHGHAQIAARVAADVARVEREREERRAAGTVARAGQLAQLEHGG